MIQSIKARFSKRALAVLAIFVVALTGSGIGSLAVLTDTATTTITASITSIDLSANGTKAATIDFGQVLPGDFRYAPVVLRNAGSGYLRLNAASVTNGSPVSLDSAVNVNVGIPVANCNPTDAPFMSNQNAVSLTQPVLFPERVVGAAGTTGANGDTLELCLVYRIGTTSGVGYGQTGLSTTLTFSAVHP